MPNESKMTIAIEGAAAGAIGSPSPGGGSQGSSAPSGVSKEQQSFFQKAKNTPKQIASFSKAQLGIQFGIAAMLRQSQIATGFLGALFQVLGALMDAFLAAFAPTFFDAITGLTKLIPVAKAMGEEMAYSVGDLKERVVAFLEPIWRAIQATWKALMPIAEFLAGMPQGMKNILLIAVISAKLLNFFQIKYFRLLAMTMTKVNAKGAAGSAGASAMKMLSSIPHAKIALIVVAVVAAVAVAIFSIFKSKTKADERGAVDVSGQLGKRYGVSQASQLGTSLNEAMSGVTQVFTDGVIPMVVAMKTLEKATNDTSTAFGGMYNGVKQQTDLMMKQKEYGMRKNNFSDMGSISGFEGQGPIRALDRTIGRFEQTMSRATEGGGRETINVVIDQSSDFGTTGSAIGRYMENGKQVIIQMGEDTHR